MTTNKSYHKNIYNYEHTPNLVLNKSFKFHSIVIPDKFIDQGTPESMYRNAKMDSNSIVNKIKSLIKC